MTCYEYDQIVFQTDISSGRVGTVTPPAASQPAPRLGRRMSPKTAVQTHGRRQLAADIEAYELVGVPWTVFHQYDHLPFQGHAFHGTYWHDNYGVPMSSGCINMRNHEAKWFFRWCLPKAGADQTSVTLN
jgi:lipoprotein-anchoring transpeptidase ErfK/SrfK